MLLTHETTIVLNKNDANIVGHMRKAEQSFPFTKAKQARGFTSAKRSGGCAVSR